MLGRFAAVNALGEEIACAKRIVGEYCVAFEPRTDRMSIRQTDFATIMQHERDFNSGVSRYWDFKSEPIHASQCAIEQISSADHVRAGRCGPPSYDAARNVSYDNRVYAYAIDEAAWHMNRYPRQLVENMGRNWRAAFRRKCEVIAPDTRRTHTRDEPDPRITYPNFNFGLPELPDFLR